MKKAFIKILVTFTIVIISQGLSSAQNFNGGNGDGFDNMVSEQVNFKEIASVKTFNGNFEMVKALPNPSHGNVFVKLPENVKTQKTVLFDILGNEYELRSASGIENNGLMKLDISDYKAGMYFIKIISQNKIFLAKINIY